ncbi:MAG TPA: SAM-dependent DNA methyltransferase, partial [Candidatus Binatia bacterium]|nr:SAM-dependent DNA methyltransferase [Candidatus Binatia bacterium]
VERPLRLKSQLKRIAIETLRFASGDEALRAEIWGKYGDKLYSEFPKLKPEIEAWLKGDTGEDKDEDEPEGDEDESTPPKKAVPEKRRKKLLDSATWQRDKTLIELALLAQQELGDGMFDDHNDFRARFEAAMAKHGKKLAAAEKKAIFKAVSWRDESAPPLVAKRTKLKKDEHFEPGLDRVYLQEAGKDRFMVEYEPDTDLRDTEQVPLKERGGIDAFFRREVLPHAPDAWIATDATKIGYEISFARYFYKPAPLRSLDQIRADILKLEQQTEGLLQKIVGGVPA